MRRRPTAELLDTDQGTPREIDASLADLNRINRWFGGLATTRSMLQHVAAHTGRRQLSLLEVASGAGYVAATARDQLAPDLSLTVTLLDRAHSHIRNGVQAVRRVAGDALCLPFADSSFDLVNCGLFAHHLSPDELRKFATEALRVSRVAVLINDLIRHPLHLALVYAGLPLYRSRLTRHDAPASVRQAYTVDEMRTLLRETPASSVEVADYFLFRMGAIAWKSEPQ